MTISNIGSKGDYWCCELMTFILASPQTLPRGGQPMSKERGLLVKQIQRHVTGPVIHVCLGLRDFLSHWILSAKTGTAPNCGHLCKDRR